MNGPVPVAVIPKNNCVRLCGDYTITVNPVMDVEQYRLPHSEKNIRCTFRREIFSVLDLSNACQQLLLDDESHKFVAINIHHDLYQYSRLAFGVASTAAVFLKMMDMILHYAYLRQDL